MDKIEKEYTCKGAGSYNLFWMCKKILGGKFLTLLKSFRTLVLFRAQEVKEPKEDMERRQETG